MADSCTVIRVKSCRDVARHDVGHAAPNLGNLVLAELLHNCVVS